MSRGHWIAVASAENVRRGRKEGIMQLSHGKEAPLKRVKPGDGVVYCSRRRCWGKGWASILYRHRADMGSFKPYRRDVAWADAKEAPIKPLLERLDSLPAKRIGVINCASGSSP